MKAAAWIWTAVVFATLLLLLGYQVQRYEHVPLLILFASLGGLGYFLARQNLPLQKLMTIALLFRLILLFATPKLSDDYHRFLWDGQLVLEGTHPFALTPAEYLLEPRPESFQEQYLLLNSTEYYSIYPPIHQMVFVLGALGLKVDYHLGIVIMRLILILLEMGTLYLLFFLLKHWQKPTWWLGIYAFHPLVIIELIGNLHFEGVMLFFLLLALSLTAIKRENLAGVAFGLSIATKLLPLIALPAWLLFFHSSRRWKFLLITILSVIVLFLPLWQWSTLVHMGQSINLYFRSFEFNPSLYALARSLGYLLTGYNQIAFIGPTLAICSALGIIWFSFTFRHKPFAWQLAFIWAIYFAFATTVHPWYLIPLLGLGLLAGLRFPMIWSLVIFLSYMQYQENEVIQMPWLWIIEYGLVAIALVVDLRRPYASYPFGKALT